MTSHSVMLGKLMKPILNRGRDKRRGAESAERRREILNVIRSLDGGLSATRSTLRFSAAFAPPRFSRPVSTAFVRLKLFCALFLVANFLGYAVGNANAGATNESASATEKTNNRESSQKRTVAPKPDSEQGFVSMFNGKDLTGWAGSDFVVEDGILVCHGHHGGGLSYTKSEFTNFVLRFEVKLSPGANNGLNFRTDGAVWNEIQILDDTHPMFTNIHPYQAHGSIYGVAPAKRGFLKPVGEWNYQEVIAAGSHIKVRLNGEVIVDADLSKLDLDKCLDGTAHPGLRRTSGGIGWLGHLNGYEKVGPVFLRNLRIKTLP